MNQRGLYCFFSYGSVKILAKLEPSCRSTVEKHFRYGEATRESTEAGLWQENNLLKSVQNCRKNLDRMQVRNEDPCTHLFAEYEQLLAATARRYQPGGYYQDAYQEACVAFMNTIREWQPDLGVPFPAFAKAKVRGDVRTAMRRIWRYEDRRILAQNHGEADEEAVNELWDMATAGLSDIELSLDIANLIEQAELSARERLYVKWLLEGRTLKEMASLAHVSVETVKTWRKRGMYKLRSKIEFLMIDDELG